MRIVCRPGDALDEPRQCVHENGRRRHVTGHAALNHEPQRRFARNLDHVARVRRADVHLQFERQHFLAAAHTARKLPHAGNGAFRHGEKLGLDGFVGQHGRDALLEVIELPAQSVRKKNERLGKPNVTDLALLVQRVELRFRSGWRPPCVAAPRGAYRHPPRAARAPRRCADTPSSATARACPSPDRGSRPCRPRRRGAGRTGRRVCRRSLLCR